MNAAPPSWCRQLLAVALFPLLLLWSQAPIRSNQIRPVDALSVPDSPGVVSLAPGAALQSEGWTTLLSEDFEGDFPAANNWSLIGDPTWSAVDCSVHQGTRSAWPAGSGSSCSGNYFNNQIAWMRWGPFSLAEASQARLDFWLLLDTEVGGDYVRACASVDGSAFYCDEWSGSSSDLWEARSLNLASVPDLGSVLGQSRVWVQLGFLSNVSITRRGPYIDDVSLRMLVGEEPTATSTPTPSPTPPSTATATLSPTATSTFSPSATQTSTATPSATSTATHTPTASPSTTPESSATRTVTPTATASPTAAAADAPVVHFSVSLYPGWNLISLPLEPLSPLGAESLLAQMRSQALDAGQIAAWASGAWVVHVRGFGANDFDVVRGQGYFVRLAGPGGSWRMTGRGQRQAD